MATHKAKAKKAKAKPTAHSNVNRQRAKPVQVSEGVKRFIISQMAKGVSKEKIFEMATKAGWKGRQIERVVFEIERKGLKFIKNEHKADMESKDVKILNDYKFKFMDIEVRVIIYGKKGTTTPFYHMIIPAISGTTDLILEEIRLKMIDQMSLGSLEISEGEFEKLDNQVQLHLMKLIQESFPHATIQIQKFLASYLISRVLGLGIVEIIKADDELEEVVINSSKEPIYVYHKKWGWCKSNQYLKDDNQIVHLAAMTGRRIGREITALTPLLDAHLPNGDRVNATLMPVTTEGPTMTIRKFSADPWTITKFLKTKTMDYRTAAIIWLAIQYEMSMLVVGGTASGKTSALNVLTNFIPPTQRVISIEDTREIRLPKYMHWVPMVSKDPNPEGKGGIQMEDLLVNSLRMRPDRIIVGEVRKRVQAETLFEAIHTGHSCYATFHANNTEEAIVRLTNPPVALPKSVLPAVSLMIVQYRNRRSGLRRTFQISEITKTGEGNVIFQYNSKKDIMEKVGKSITFFETLELYTGNTIEELEKDMEERIKVLKYMVKKNYSTIDEVGKVMAMYYTEKDELMKEINKTK